MIIIVHTIDIGLLFYSRDEAIELMRLFRFSRPSMKKFDIKGFARKDMGRIRKGIKYFQMTKCLDKANHCIGYSFIIRMEPWLLITQKESIDLFECSEENIARLTDLFREFMAPYVHDTDYAYLVEFGEWNCRRIDYTHNLHFDNERDAETFYRLSKRTSLHQRTKVKRRKDEQMFAQSTAEGNCSSKSIFYDKRAQIEEDYAGMDENDLDDLMESAENVIRYEIQCYKGKVSSIKRKYNIQTRSILWFLNEDIANELLFKQYEASIGYGDFYELYRAKSRIMHYEGTLGKGQRITQDKKEKLVQFMQLVADVRGLDKARKCFREGRVIKNTKERILVKGSDNTFRSRIKDLAVLGINPVAIPRRNSKRNADGEVKVYDYPKFLENPIHSW